MNMLADDNLAEDEDINSDEDLETTNLEDDEPELDDDGNPITPEIEDWMKEDGDQTLSDVPAGKYIRTKQKLKGRISEQNSEIEKLKAENARLQAESVKVSKPVELPRRPKEDAFDTTAAYEAALDEYEEQIAATRYDNVVRKKQLEDKQRKVAEEVANAVDEHYGRADALIVKHGIKPEVYQKADETVRLAVEAVIPKGGDAVVDHLISLLGEGSEKVMFKLGRNKTFLAQFQTALIADKTGLKASILLGQEKERLSNTGKRTSMARPPASSVEGDAPAGKGGALKRKYDAAHKKNNGQEAYNIKKEARKAGVDVSGW
jgi:hypothetical protein